MKTLITTLLFACTVFGHAQLITITQPHQAQEAAASIAAGCNDAIQERVLRLKNMWSTLWENERATPEQILAALGTNASKVFQAAALARTDLEAIATLAGTTPAILLGDAKYLTPKLAITFHQDGRVTLTTP
jgi:hypothetical protein